MSLEALIQTHGYWIIFVGTFIEGETVLVLGGIAAHSGTRELPKVILAAFLGSLFCDQIFFQLGRRHGETVLARKPEWQTSIRRVDGLLARHDLLLVVGFRFLYGLRTVTPFAVGMSTAISTGRFMLLNLIGAAVWAIAVGTAGYALGNAVQALLDDARKGEAILFVGVLAIAGTLWLIRFVRRRRSRASDPPPPIES